MHGDCGRVWEMNSAAKRSSKGTIQLKEHFHSLGTEEVLQMIR